MSNVETTTPGTKSTSTPARYVEPEQGVDHPTGGGADAGTAPTVTAVLPPRPAWASDTERVTPTNQHDYAQETHSREVGSTPGGMVVRVEQFVSLDVDGLHVDPPAVNLTHEGDPCWSDPDEVEQLGLALLRAAGELRAAQRS